MMSYMKIPHGVVTPSHTVEMQDVPSFEEYTKEYSNKSGILAVGVIYKPQASSSINFHINFLLHIFFSKCNRTWRFKRSVTYHTKVVKNDVVHENTAWDGNSLPYSWDAGCAMF